MLKITSNSNIRALKHSPVVNDIDALFDDDNFFDTITISKRN